MPWRDRLAGPARRQADCRTAITPTPPGEGKTTTAISLVQGLGHRREATPCLREPSLGPVFGDQGRRGGRRPRAARADGYRPESPLHGRPARDHGCEQPARSDDRLASCSTETNSAIDPLSITWRRCLDMNDRALRQIVVGLGGRSNGYPRETGFDITAASEVMAILAMARDLDDLRARLGAITVGATRDGEPVTAEQLRPPGP